MAYSIEATAADCYDGTTCLINKLGIRDEAKLADTEAAIVLAKASYLFLHPIPGDYDLNHLCAIHRYLFSDLYDWAGELRTISISKKTTTFVPPAEIKHAADACFDRIRKIDFPSLREYEFAAELADFYNTLNMIHPFREGNGRTQRLFFSLWLRDIGYEFDFTSIDQDLFMIATIKAAQGVLDDLAELFHSHVISCPVPGLQTLETSGGHIT